MSLDCTDCTRTTGNDYCLDYLARCQIGLADVCGPCLGRIMAHFDLAAGRDLPWPQWLRDRAGAPAPTPLRSYRDAGLPEAT